MSYLEYVIAAYAVFALMLAWDYLAPRLAIARQLRAEAAIDLRSREVNRRRRFRCRIAIDDALRDRASAHVLQQLAGAVERARRVRNIDTALKAARCLGMEAAGTRRAADARAIERSGLEDDRRRLVRDFRFKAAHDARESGRMLGIGDDELVALRDARRIVERMEVLACGRTARRQLVARDFIIIIGMHRLAELEHDEIRDIDDIVDGADAGTFEALLHPGRRRADLDVLDDTRTEAVAEVIGLDTDFYEVGGFCCIIFLAGNRRPFRSVARQHGDFAHEAEHAEAVAAVRRKLEFEDDIALAEHVFCRHADRRVIWQDVDAVELVFRHLRRVEMELARRAEHAV